MAVRMTELDRLKGFKLQVMEACLTLDKLKISAENIDFETRYIDESSKSITYTLVGIQEQIEQIEIV